eukprot:m.515699 g.515699  ORF g.515699 m.515699 type:complete len:60 (+) comp21923_c0_seq15:341-520(+)
MRSYVKESSAKAADAYRRNAEKLAEKSAVYKAALKEKSRAMAQKYVCFNRTAHRKPAEP